MGSCLTKYTPEQDMGKELEYELNATSRKQRQDNATTFGSTSLLAADEVVCHEEIGNGPFGPVFKGTYRGSDVAVKKMKISRPDRGQGQGDMEMDLSLHVSRMGSLRHPNIVLFMGACLQGSYFCIVNEYCARRSLYDIIHAPPSSSSPPPEKEESSEPSSQKHHRRVTLKWKDRINLALSAARGLVFLHSADAPLVHGHLKSSNILVIDRSTAKIDYGMRNVAEALGAVYPNDHLQDPSSYDTLHRWTAPELWRQGEEKVRQGIVPTGLACPQAADIYSFGIIMYELLTEQIPFAEVENNRELRSHIASCNRPDLSKYSKNSNWKELMTRCWAQSPTRRPSAQELVSVLESIKADELEKKNKGKQDVKAVNSNRADYMYADRPRSKSKPKSKFTTNVRIAT